MENDIRFVRGDSYVFFLETVNANGTIYTPQITDTLTMTVRVGDENGAIALQKLSGTSDVVIVPGGWEVTIRPEDTSSLAYVDYVYDIELNLQGYVQTYNSMCKFNLRKEVTYPTPLSEDSGGSSAP